MYGGMLLLDHSLLLKSIIIWSEDKPEKLNIQSQKSRTSKFSLQYIVKQLDDKNIENHQLVV